MPEATNQPNEENIPAEFVFPKTWDACPNCGNPERLIEKIANEEKAAGKMPKNVPVGVQFGNLAICDPSAPASRVPLLSTRFDICTQCGTFYCIYVDKQIAQTQIQLPNQPGPHNPGRNPFSGPFINPRLS